MGERSSERAAKRRIFEVKPDLANKSNASKVYHRNPTQAGAREALGLSPLVQVGWADASSVKGVPRIAAGAEPLVLLAGRPSAERAADARAGRIVFLLLIKFVIQNCG
jgi:hypothetical protein